MFCSDIMYRTLVDEVMLIVGIKSPCKTRWLDPCRIIGTWGCMDDNKNDSTFLEHNRKSDIHEKLIVKERAKS